MVELIHVNKTYNLGREDEVLALDDVSLAFPKSGLIALYGKSGSGKSTLLNVIGGLIKADSGEIVFDGENVSKEADSARIRRVGYIFQNYCLSEERTVFDNVADALRLTGMSDKAVIKQMTEDALQCVGISRYADRYPHTLSGGQQQRVAIARAIVKKPAVVLADEPTGNLDENNKIIVMNLLASISKNCLVILVSHDRELVEKYCGGIVSVKDGVVSGIEKNEPQADGFCDRQTIVKGSVSENTKGVLFHWKDSLKRGWNDVINNSTGKKPLRWCLLILSVVFVMVSAHIGKDIKDIIEIKERNNENIFYGFLKNEEMVRQFLQKTESGETGISGFVYSEEPVGGDRFFLINYDGYESSGVSDWGKTVMLNIHGVVLPARMLNNTDETVNLSGNEALITRGMAEQVIRRGMITTIRTPESLIGFTMRGFNLLRISGIVESEEPAVYVSDDYYARWRYGYEFAGVNLKKRSDMKAGEVIIRNNSPVAANGSVAAGDNVEINGVSLRVINVIDEFYSYPDWLSEFKKDFMKMPDESSAWDAKESYRLWNEYFSFYAEYLEYCKTHREIIHFDSCMELALQGNRYAELYLKEELCGLSEYYYAEMFYDDNQRYPEDGELEYCHNNYPSLTSRVESLCGDELLWRNHDTTYELSEDDYMACAFSFGQSNGYGLGTIMKPSGYVVIRSDDPKKTDAFAESFFTEYDLSGFSYVSPLQRTKEDRVQMLRERTFSFVIWVIVAAAVVFVMYMVVRSGLARKENDFAVYRCIGVNRKNVAYRYLVETGVLLVTTAVLSAVVIGMILVILCNGKYSGVFAEYFGYPVLASVFSVVFLALFSLLFAVLSIWLFLRREPGELISQQNG